MVASLSFDHLQAILRQHTAVLPDYLKPSPNTCYTIQDAALGAFGLFFTQSPSFLEYQRRLQHRKGHNKAQTLFGVTQIPCDNQIRNLLDPVAPHHLTPIFLEVFEHLNQDRRLEPLRVLDNQLLVALDGTQYFSSKAIHCDNCLTRQLANGQTLYSHPAITPVVVSPGHAQVIALPPQYIMPQDGHDKQDCEQAAGKRWLRHHGATLAPYRVTLLGAGFYRKEVSLRWQTCHWVGRRRTSSWMSLIRFLGFVVRPHRRRLKRRKGIHFQRRYHRMLAAFHARALPAAQVTVRVQSGVNHVRHRNTIGLSTAVLRYPCRVS